MTRSKVNCQGEGQEPFKVGNPSIFKKLSPLPFTVGAGNRPLILKLGHNIEFFRSGFLIFGLVFCVTWLWSWHGPSVAKSQPSVPYGANYLRDAMLARVLAIIVCLSVCLSVTRRYCIISAKRRITQTTPRDSPGTLVFWCQQSMVGDPLSPLKFALKVTHPFLTRAGLSATAELLVNLVAVFISVQWHFLLQSRSVLLMTGQWALGLSCYIVLCALTVDTLWLWLTVQDRKSVHRRLAARCFSVCQMTDRTGHTR